MNIKKGKVKTKFEGCETCAVGTAYGDNEFACHSAHLWSTHYAHLKKGEKYPEWCPKKDI